VGRERLQGEGQGLRVHARVDDRGRRAGVYVVQAADVTSSVAQLALREPNGLRPGKTRVGNGGLRARSRNPNAARCRGSPGTAFAAGRTAGLTGQARLEVRAEAGKRHGHHGMGSYGRIYGPLELIPAELHGVGVPEEVAELQHVGKLRA